MSCSSNIFRVKWQPKTKMMRLRRRRSGKRKQTMEKQIWLCIYVACNSKWLQLHSIPFHSTTWYNEHEHEHARQQRLSRCLRKLHSAKVSFTFKLSQINHLQVESFAVCFIVASLHAPFIHPPTLSLRLAELHFPCKMPKHKFYFGNLFSIRATVCMTIILFRLAMLYKPMVPFSDILIDLLHIFRTTKFALGKISN